MGSEGPLYNNDMQRDNNDNASPTPINNRLNTSNNEACLGFIVIGVLAVVLAFIGWYSASTGQMVNHNELRLMLVGKTGNGKSATANTIMGEEYFKAKVSAKAVTKLCELYNKIVHGRNITIIDTPGLFDTDEAGKRFECMDEQTPQVFLLVIRIGRFTKEEVETVKWIQEAFGEESNLFTMIVFTHGDQLHGQTIEEFINQSPELLKLVNSCNSRYHVFDNRDTYNQIQVKHLFEKIDEMMRNNYGYTITKERIKKAQTKIREEEKIQKEKLAKHLADVEHEKEQAEQASNLAFSFIVFVIVIVACSCCFKK